jgi:hypothetical protein
MKIPTKRQLEKRGIKIVVGVPMERTFHNVPFLHFWNIARRGWELTPIIYGRTDANRNKMAAWLRDETDFTHICMLDGDHAHPEDIVERLAVHVLRDPKKLVVGGLNFRRTAPYDPCVFRYGDDGRLHPPISWEDGCIPVDAIGAGCILISRKVFEQVEPPWWAYGYNWAHINKYPSEDMFFSQQMRVHDIQIWCDTTTTSPHMGDMYIDANSFQAFIKANPETVSVIGKNN